MTLCINQLTEMDEYTRQAKMAEFGVLTSIYVMHTIGYLYCNFWKEKETKKQKI